MTPHKHKERRQWRYSLKRFQWRINQELALLAMLIAILLAQPTPATAQTKWDYCRPIAHGQVCVNRAQRVTRITCDAGYQPQFGRVPRCIAQSVQP